jgi:hypothetical protein
MARLEQKGIVGPDEGSPGKGREVFKRAESTSGQAAAKLEPEPLDGLYDWTDEDWEDLDKA